jgi:NTP pyrophosphatase (non-canonical NTP hydrolase)
MELQTYQNAVSATDCLSSQERGDPLVPLLGLAGEVGELQGEYKKAIRDGDAIDLYRNRFAEELGDVLWYVANLATKLGFDLNQIAEQNLEKAKDRWGQRTGLDNTRPPFDEGFSGERAATEETQSPDQDGYRVVRQADRAGLRRRQKAR